MKKRLITSELGSMMIEALAMLALIAAITPILYRKTAERTTELQDINSAGEIRSIIKAVDDYVSANFDAISQGETVTTTCNGTNASFNYEDLKDQTDAHVTVPLGHFCEFLPYGILDSSGNAKSSRLFSSNYQVVLKLKGDGEENGDRVVTSFVVTEPNMEMREMRSSSIASMIGGNGGYVTEGTTGTGEEASGGKISGNLGIWGIDDAKTELGVTVKKGAIVAASIQGISSQNAKIDLEGVLYRKEQSDRDLNTMSTTLYMGATGSAERNSIVNIRDLIVGGEAEGENTLYINQGGVSIGNDANFSSTGVSWKDVALSSSTDGLAISNSTNITGSLSATVDANIGGNLNVVGSADIGNILDVSDIFHVGLDTADAGFIIGPSQTTIKMPINVTATNSCTSADWTQCALNVVGDVHVGGDLTVDNSFSAKNLHAQEKLTVGTDNKALNITYTTDTGASSLDFGNGFITAKNTSSEQIFRIGPDTDNFFVADKKTNEIYANAAKVQLNSTTASSYTGFGSDGVNAGIYASTDAVNESAYFEIQSSGEAVTDASKSYTMTSPEIQANATQHLINLNNDDTLGNGIFKVTPNGGGTANYFSIENIAEEGYVGKVNVKGMPTYMSGGTAHLTMTGGADIIVQNSEETPENIVRIGDNASPASGQIDISSDGIFAKDSGTWSTDGDGNTSRNAGSNVLKIDLTANSTSNGDYPVYIRKGAIELTDGLTVGTADETGEIIATNGTNYVRADRFVANKTLERTALVKYDGTNIGLISGYYEVNPAYTSVMHDIKLISRGGARLSDILPDFVNKGIYLVDNTYPALGYECDGYTGKSVNDYRKLTREDKQNTVKTCSFTNDKVSSWLGFVPTPTCPPGYSKVITVTPVGFNIAQAGILYAGNNAEGDPIDDISIMSYSKPVSTDTGATDMPLYHQKNTWLKSFAEAYKTTGGVFEGWDVGIGYMYPEYAFGGIDELLASTPGLLDPDITESEDGSIEVIWNLFPVYAGTLEGYATVYCYFNRANDMWSPLLVDTQYDQLGNFRAVDSKSAGGIDNVGYIERLKGGNSNLNEW